MLRLRRVVSGLSLLLVIVSVITVVSCQPAATPTAAPPTEAAPPEGEPIKFGLVGPMTGDAADYGRTQEAGASFAVAEINAAGGINGRPVELVICDDKCDPYEGSMCAQKMVADPEIFAVIGHVCSSCTLAGGPIYEEAGLTLVTASSTNPTVCEQGWTHVFRTISHDGNQGPELAGHAINTLGKKRLAIMYASHDYGQGLLDATVPAVSELGGEVVAVETYVPGVDKDFSAQLTKIAEAEPDALLLLTDYAEGGMITKQRVAAGLGDVPVLAAAGCQHTEFIDLAGEAGEGAFVVAYYDPFSPMPVTKAFNEKWLEEFGERPVEIEAFNYEVPYILKLAVEAGATKENLHEVLHTIEFEGPTGLTVFDETGDVAAKTQVLLTVKNGEFVSYVP